MIGNGPSHFFWAIQNSFMSWTPLTLYMHDARSSPTNAPPTSSTVFMIHVLGVRFHLQTRGILFHHVLWNCSTKIFSSLLYILAEINNVQILLKYAKRRNRTVKAVRMESHSFKALGFVGFCVHRVITHMKVKQIPLLHRNKLRWKTDNAL